MARSSAKDFIHLEKVANASVLRRHKQYYTQMRGDFFLLSYSLVSNWAVFVAAHRMGEVREKT